MDRARLERWARRWYGTDQEYELSMWWLRRLWPVFVFGAAFAAGTAIRAVWGWW